jgi:hypothetical protein
LPAKFLNTVWFLQAVILFQVSLPIFTFSGLKNFYMWGNKYRSLGHVGTFLQMHFLTFTYLSGLNFLQNPLVQEYQPIVLGTVIPIMCAKLISRKRTAYNTSKCI